MQACRREFLSVCMYGTANLLYLLLIYHIHIHTVLGEKKLQGKDRDFAVKRLVLLATSSVAQRIKRK